MIKIETLREKRQMLMVGLQEIQAQMNELRAQAEQQRGAIYLVDALLEEMEADPAEGSPDSPAEPATDSTT